MRKVLTNKEDLLCKIEKIITMKNNGNGGERQVALERAGIKVDSSKGAKV